MNLRQAQRAVVELVAKCQDLQLELPPEPFQLMLEAVQALKHSQRKGRIQPNLAMEEMEQRYPIPALKAQQEQRQAASTTSNRKRGRPRKNRAIQDEQDLTEEEDKSPVKKNSAHLQALTTKGSSSGSSSNSSEGASKQKSSRISKIQQNNPPKREENKELTDQFVELGDHELKHGEKQKGISRMKVAKELRNTEQVIESGEQARHLERVGPSASKKVDEIRNKGTIKALKRYHEEEEEEAEDVPQKS